VNEWRLWIMLIKEMLRQSLPLLVACGLGGMVAGNTLGAMIEVLRDIPGLIVVIPALIALRGNISTALSSRLGSAYHLGIIDAHNMWNEELKENIVGSLVLSLLMSLIIGFLSYFTSLLLNIQPDPLRLISIVILAGIISGGILTFLTVVIIYIVFKKGYNPDNIGGPALATFGDIVTMLSIFGSAILIGG
jgi:mgtE-like transporter